MARITTKASTGQRPIPLPRDASPMWIAIDVEFPAVSPPLNDLIALCQLPIGVKCLDWQINFPDVDTNGTPLLATSLGVENAGGTDLSAEVWGAGLTAGQSTAIVRNTTSVSAQGDITTARNIALKVTAAAATYAGLNKTGQVLLLLQA